MALAWITAAGLAACASAPTSDSDDGSLERSHLEQVLAGYRDMGFLTGTTEFPVVGRVVALRGPEDSAFVGVVASMPPSALEFNREGRLFAASYQVLATIRSADDTVGRINRREIVRVDDFTETADTDERIFFQHFVKLPAGDYDIDVTFRELSSREQGSCTFGVRIPRAGVPQYQLSTPLVAYRATPRQAYGQPPPVILSPRSTVDVGSPPLYLLVEDYSAASGLLRVGVRTEGLELWAQNLEPETPGAGPASVIVPLPMSALLPGRSEVFVTRMENGATRSAPLMVGLDDEWAYTSFALAVDHLRYVVDPDSLEMWVEAAQSDRVRLWADFWEATDTDPDSPENEFLDVYFERMTLANQRYAEPGIPGWRTDRGRALIQLGEPDREFARGGLEVGERPLIEWVYDESLPFGVRLTFVDETDFGVFTLTQRSRITLRQAHRKLRDMQLSGEVGPEDQDPSG
jgi:GWxTD domain-containing protein